MDSGAPLGDPEKARGTAGSPTATVDEKERQHGRSEWQDDHIERVDPGKTIRPKIHVAAPLYANYIAEALNLRLRVEDLEAANRKLRIQLEKAGEGAPAPSTSQDKTEETLWQGKAQEQALLIRKLCRQNAILRDSERMLQQRVQALSVLSPCASPSKRPDAQDHKPKADRESESPPPAHSRWRGPGASDARRKQAKNPKRTGHGRIIARSQSSASYGERQRVSYELQKEVDALREKLLRSEAAFSRSIQREKALEERLRATTKDARERVKEATSALERLQRVRRGSQELRNAAVKGLKRKAQGIGGFGVRSRKAES